MPIYEYACKACGHEFEREQRIHDAPLRKCPGCGKMQVKRLISRTSFVLKGGGWFNDLYASGKLAKDGDKPGAKSEAKAESGADKASGDKSAGGGKPGKPASGGKEAA